MATFTIAQIERAINIWCSREASKDNVALSGPARSLATPYALLIFTHRSEIDENELSADQLEALRAVL